MWGISIMIQLKAQTVVFASCRPFQYSNLYCRIDCVWEAYSCWALIKVPVLQVFTLFSWCTAVSGMMRLEASRAGGSLVIMEKTSWLWTWRRTRGRHRLQLPPSINTKRTKIKAGPYEWTPICPKGVLIILRSMWAMGRAHCWEQVRPKPLCIYHIYSRYIILCLSFFYHHHLCGFLSILFTFSLFFSPNLCVYLTQIWKLLEPVQWGY